MRLLGFHAFSPSAVELKRLYQEREFLFFFLMVDLMCNKQGFGGGNVLIRLKKTSFFFVFLFGVDARLGS